MLLLLLWRRWRRVVHAHMLMVWLLLLHLLVLLNLLLLLQLQLLLHLNYVYHLHWLQLSGCLMRYIARGDGCTKVHYGCPPLRSLHVVRVLLWR